jgi:hypothetical protein
MNATGFKGKTIVLGLVTAIAAAGLVMAHGGAPAGAAEEGRVLRHIVLFDLKAETDAETLAAIEAGANQMGVDIEQIQHIEWGRNLDFNTRNDGYDFVLLVEFASIEDLEIYGPHPDHDVFRDIVRPHVERILVVDYWGKTR